MQAMLYLSSNNQDAERSLRIETAERDGPLDIVSEVGPMLGAVLPNMPRIVNVLADGMCFQPLPCRLWRSGGLDGTARSTWPGCSPRNATTR